MIASSALAPGWPGVWGEAVAGLGRFHAFCQGRYAFADWDEALERLFGAVDEGLIILDEFPYMMKASPSLPSLIQRALGPRGEGAVDVVADPLRRSQIQVDAAVFAPDEPGRQRRVLSLGEAKWDKVMNPGHLERLRQARRPARREGV